MLGPPLAVLGPLPSGVLLQGGTGDVGSHGSDDDVVGLSVIDGSLEGGPGGALALLPRRLRLSYLLRSRWKY